MMTVSIQKTAVEAYGPRWYKLDPQTLDSLKELKPYRPVLAAVVTWFWIFAIVKTFMYLAGINPLAYFAEGKPLIVFNLPWTTIPLWAYALYPVTIFFIAGRAGVFLQLAHEAAHGLVSKGKFNTWFGNWIASYPIGLDFKGYADPHMFHHACTNQICDPVSDREKYRVCDIRNPKLWLLFLKDLSGITAISVRFLYDRLDVNRQLEPGMEEVHALYKETSNSKLQFIKKYTCIAVWQLGIWALLFNFSVPLYLLFWLLPLMTVHMFLMRVRGIAEHGLGVQLNVSDLHQKNQGTFYTRSFGTPLNRYAFMPLNWLERALIGSLQVYYHHEHHLYPKIPYYNLPKLHQLIGEQEKTNNPYVFARGYFDCLFFNLRHSQPPKTSQA